MDGPKWEERGAGQCGLRTGRLIAQEGMSKYSTGYFRCLGRRLNDPWARRVGRENFGPLGGRHDVVRAMRRGPG